MKIVIAGGAGQVGTVLARHFHATGHEVVVLSRTLGRAAAWRVVAWDGVTLGKWRAEVDGCEVLINLAGRSVNCRYDAANRRKIMDSRVFSTRVLHEAVAVARRRPRVWLNASTATIYRHSLDRAMDEVTGELGGEEVGVPETWRFSIMVAKAWEEAFFAAAPAGVRMVALRSAMTFSPDASGVFDVFLGLVRWGLGGTNLPGNQYVSWIHEVDFVRAVEFLIEREDMDGAVNLASPHPLPNREFLRVLREAWGTRVGIPTTRWMLEVGCWAMRTESELVLKSRRVVPGRLVEAGYALNLTEMTDRTLKAAMNEVPENSMVLFEDIDCMGTGNRRRAEADNKEKKAATGVTLSGLLNVLDGFHAPENVVFAMTTNHAEALDPALLRPGRIDYKLYLGAAGAAQKEELYRRFFPRASALEAGRFARAHGLETMAECQGRLLRLEEEGGWTVCERASELMQR